MSDKLKVLVRMDLECAAARIDVSGLVDTRNIRALYALAQKTNSLTPGLEITLDLSAASAQPEALELLRTCIRSGRLPASVDPWQRECRLRLVPPATAKAGHYSPAQDVLTMGRYANA